jgi:hypothetical protein
MIRCYFCTALENNGKASQVLIRQEFARVKKRVLVKVITSARSYFLPVWFFFIYIMHSQQQPLIFSFNKPGKNTMTGRAIQVKVSGHPL